MTENDSLETARVYVDILNSALAELNVAFIAVVNEQADISIFQEAIRKLDNARAIINSDANIGLVIGIAKYKIDPVPLTGDPTKDLGQTPVDLS